LFWYQAARLISALTPEGSTTDEGMVSPHGIKPLMKRSLVCIKPTVFFTDNLVPRAFSLAWEWGGNLAPVPGKRPWD